MTYGALTPFFLYSVHSVCACAMRGTLPPCSIPWSKTPVVLPQFLCIRVEFRDIFGEPDVKGATTEHGVGR